jgi:hypothetical protein
MTVLFEGAGAEQRLVVFIKTTYSLGAGESMRRAMVDLPLTLETESEGPDERFPIGCTISETDLWESKPWTDVVVRGHVQALGGRPVQTMNAGVQVGARQKWVRVFGDRRVIRQHGQRVFSEPEPFTAIELSWRRAYGGVDLSLPHAPVEDMLDFFRLFTPEQHPGAYPRNPAGRGWVIHESAALDGMALPNFETPSQLLSPGRLIVGDRRHWTRAPIPAGFGWIRQGWFPRSTLLGLSHPEFYEQAHELPEVRTGWLSAEQIINPEPHPSFQSGASPGLRFDALALGERVVLHGFSLDGVIDTRLPSAPPEILVAFERQPLPVELRLSTVELLPDVGLANLVWAAHARPPLRLPRAMPRPGQRDYEVLAGVDVFVDGAHVPNEAVDLSGESTGGRR